MSWLNPNSDLKKQFNAFYENVEIVLGGIHQEVETIKKEYDERLSYLDQLSEYFSNPEKLNLIKKALSDTEDTRKRLTNHLKEIEAKQIQLNEHHNKAILRLDKQLNRLNEEFKNQCNILELSNSELKREIQDIKFNFGVRFNQNDEMIQLLKSELDQTRQMNSDKVKFLENKLNLNRILIYILFAVLFIIALFQFKNV